MASALIWVLSGNGEVRVINETDGPLAISLPDGSKVWLNQKAELTYPKVMNGAQREVHLVGEAYFEIVRHARQPFLVQSNGATIRILGTEFNVNAVAKDWVQVHVLEGKVAFYAEAKEERQVTLQAFEVGRLELNTGDLSKTVQENQNSIAWKTGVLRFEDEALTTMVEQLEDYYDIPFSLENSLTECTISTVIDKLSLAETLEVLELTLGISSDAQNNEILLSGTCMN